MPYSNGQYTRSYSWVDDKNNNVKITASRVDTEDDGFATALSTCLLKDGTQTVTANIPMATFKFTGVGAGTALTEYADVKSVQNSTYLYFGTTGGSANAFTASLSPAITAYVAGQRYFGIMHSTCGASSPTLNLNGIGAKNIKRRDGATAVSSGDFFAGPAEFIYDGTSFRLLTAPAAGVGLGYLTFDASGAATSVGVYAGLTCSRSSAGVYTVTVPAAVGMTTSSLVHVTCANSGAARIINANIASTTSIAVTTYDAAGVAADADRINISVYDNQ